MAPNQNKPLMMLQEKRNVLIDVFLDGNASDFLRQYTRIIDDYFLECYEQSAVGPRLNMNKNPFAVIALGGYGRQEQCIHSDIDLLILFETGVPDEAIDLVSEMIYPLWDIGIDVGHATRSLEECITAALDDIEVLTALLDARLLCGISSLYSKLMDLLRRRLVDDHSFDLIERLINRNQARHGQFGDSTYLLEPNLKEGHGGLRDYHTLMWIGRVKNHLTKPRDLVYYGWLSQDEFLRLNQALSFIWHTRNHLHNVVGRKCDQLHFDYQEQLADILDYRKKDGQQPVERFLGELHRHMSFIKQHYRIQIYELENETRQRKKRINKTTRFGGITVENGMLSFVSSEAVNRKPLLLMQIFEESAFLKLPLSAESRRMVNGFLSLVDDTLRRSDKMVRSFEKILLTPAPLFNVLEAMSETDFLQTFIAPFSQVVNCIQYDEYHLYPVDRHLLKTVQTVKTFGTEENPSGKEICGSLYAELSEQERIMLLWAALLHDIGKGEPGGNHARKGEEMVREILTRKNYDEETVDTIAFLVRRHLLLAKIATRRDIQDEETAIYCARIIKDISRLKMLYLLTVADSFATGPKAWNSWTGSLIEELFFNVFSTLKNGELTSNEAVEQVDRKKETILSSAVGDDERRNLERLLSVMSPRYLLYAGAEEIARHIQLHQRLGTANFVWHIEKNPDSNTRRVTVCAKDCPGLFSRIAGTFTLNGINILDVQVFTWRNNIALDIFDVEPPPDDIYETQKWEHAETDMESALIGTLDMETALEEKMAAYKTDLPRVGEKPHKIVVDNESSSFFTIIEVFTYDFPGLLYGITNALFNCRLDVWVAKIATKVDQVVDVFYVRDFDGQKADSPHQVAEIESAVEDFLKATSPVLPDDPA